MMSLYEIANKYQATLQKIADCDNITPELMDELESIDDDVKEKAKATAAFILNLEQHRAGIGSAILHMEERMTRAENKIESMRNYLKSNLEKCNLNEIETPMFDIKIKKNPPSVQVINVSLIPKDYYREKIKYELDKKLIAEQLKAEIEIPGVVLANNTRLEIG